ncbi:Transposase, Mutator family [Sporomusa ovata DSM 2662]|uniref:Mutator family transposase n=5 Tax=Sporomusa ovata TaxID=2378 RepID=A0A0U1KVZ4_9FIRM|nr:IS256 family transposase [Sporomusa ovata]EQB25335.1 transposase for insertion sequence element ISRM3 [Sporomusa ovata DSM 2662]EQB26760.1 transposase for insertion sequence element ISRM3 [Sporomusa ovata DSM 2662]EQB27117.1 transposase for insertion sequence element ISRM3 [Sporomusa ovata DSM 2662]EQB27601.1 transposase for insertion sequence element ISRM3 [Sporomusa ovata DSM 2662]CQR70854.1 Mobile element protein [Sporomusa ovata]
MHEREQELVGLLSKQCTNMEDVHKLLKSLFKSTLEEMLEAEMDEHLGYQKHDLSGNNSGNSRNGYGKKTLQTELGETELRVPRDRNGTFAPQVVEKRQTKSEDLEGRIIAMYAKGMSNRDIEDHLRDIYGVEASASLISRITDKIMPAVQEWQVRPLDGLYPIVFLDGIVFKVRKDAKIINKCVYSVLGINMDGRKEILGIWMSENESASFWLTICNELKNRGVQDILIACRDNLSGFSDAIATVFPKTEQQLCVIHQIRNSTKYVPYKDIKAVMADLKLVYGALSLDDAEYRLEEFGEKWGKKYPQIVKSWEANWTELSTYFKYPEEVRRLIYTTNAVEGFHRMLRKYTKTKTIYPTDDAVRKSVFLSIQEITKKWSMPVRDWGIIIGQLMIFFDGRFQRSLSA